MLSYESDDEEEWSKPGDGEDKGKEGRREGGWEGGCLDGCC